MITSVEIDTSNITTELRVPELSYNTVEDDKTDETRLVFMLDEFFAVLVLLIGTLHLIEAVTPKLLQNAFWYSDNKNNPDPILSGGVGFSSRHFDIHRQLHRLTLAVDRLNKPVDTHIAKDGEATKKTDPSGSSKPNEPSGQPEDEIDAYVPVPFMLIFQLSILLAGVSRAFPSAHLSPHISLYKGHNDDEISWDCVGMRLVGGMMASITALMYYFIWYVWVGKPPGKRDAGNTATMRMCNYAMVPGEGHAMFNTEMLRLPRYMMLDRSMSGIAEEVEAGTGLHLG